MATGVLRQGCHSEISSKSQACYMQEKSQKISEHIVTEKKKKKSHILQSLTHDINVFCHFNVSYFIDARCKLVL